MQGCAGSSLKCDLAPERLSASHSLTFEECHEKYYDSGATTLECVAEGPGFEVRLVSFGGADEADLTEVFEHLRPMSDVAFYQEARRYIEVVPG